MDEGEALEWIDERRSQAADLVEGAADPSFGSEGTDGGSSNIVDSGGPAPCPAEILLRLNGIASPPTPAAELELATEMTPKLARALPIWARWGGGWRERGWGGMGCSRSDARQERDRRSGERRRWVSTSRRDL
jgi:hypothetical protein